MNPEALLKRLQSGQYRNVKFRDFEALAHALGFGLERISGSHVILRNHQHRLTLVVQPERSGDAKPYQLRNLVEMIGKAGLSIGGQKR